MLRLPTSQQLIQAIGNSLFLILILVLMLDPGNSIFHLKEKVFLLCLAFNCIFFKPNWRMLLPVLAVFSVLLIGYIVAEIQENPIDERYFFGTLKGLSPILFLLWVHHYDVLKISRIPSILTICVILILYSVIASSPLIQHAVFLYSQEHNEMVMITSRNVLGIKVFGMYYRSIVSIIPPLFCFLFFAHQHRFRHLGYVLISLLFVVAFFISGTRAMMLTPLFLLGIIFYKDITQRPRARYFLYPLLALLGALFLVLIGLLATQQGDESNSVKYAHLTSYLELFTDHPQYLLWGQGAGTMFYSLGFKAMTAETEWIYIELLRNYGLFSLIILAVFFYPLVVFYRHREDSFTTGIAVSYVAFLLIAGTNPFLLNSQGITVLWMMYSHALRLQASTTALHNDS